MASVKQLFQDAGTLKEICPFLFAHHLYS